MSGTDGSWAPVIGRDESRLRVLAGCAATIIAGWTIYAASHIAGASGWLRIWWGAGCFWGAFHCAIPLARAFGRQKGWVTWLVVGGYVFYLPFLTLVFVLVGPSPTGERPFIDLAGSYSKSLAIASMIGLLGLAMMGSALEKQSSLSHRQQPGG